MKKLLLVGMVLGAATAGLAEPQWFTIPEADPVVGCDGTIFVGVTGIQTPSNAYVFVGYAKPYRDGDDIKVETIWFPDFGFAMEEAIIYRANHEPEEGYVIWLRLEKFPEKPAALVLVTELIYPYWVVVTSESTEDGIYHTKVENAHVNIPYAPGLAVVIGVNRENPQPLGYFVYPTDDETYRLLLEALSD
ncbi:MAG: hypothetical protein DRN68_09575 [Thaumarchaeota archaeon]|nr:MAG: hypothetical protein DRN68_09575 [Nitrososphaerota archaeon]